MTTIHPERVTARIDGDFVVFLIGMRINKPWLVHKWWPTVMAMRRMLAELETAGPASGLLGTTALGCLALVQYWRSFDHLEAYARGQDRLHWPAWIDFNRRMKHCRGDVGIWHETYLVPAGQYEAVYGGMPLWGQRAAGETVEVGAGNDGARDRLGAG